ncbi:hypothetical protein LG288_05265 [Idiomarina seosinensis]|uniref:hypothetical protein n=1 Tax=Idiomarina seosinensis TaxID=281739 RepID=UPI00384FB883
MKYSLGIAVLLFIGGVPGVTCAQTDTSAAQRALQKLQQQQTVEFGYKRRSDFGERTVVEQFDPRQQPPWILLKENKQQPSAQRREEYSRMKQDELYGGEIAGANQGERKENEQQSIKVSLQTLVQSETLQPLQKQQWQGQSVRTFGFDPDLDKFSDHNDKLQGYLYLDSNDDRLVGLEITLKESFSPAMSVSLSRYHMEIQLQTISHGQQRYTVPQRTTEEMTGEYLYFIDFSEQTLREYYDYQVLERPAAAN